MISGFLLQSSSSAPPDQDNKYKNKSHELCNYFLLNAPTVYIILSLGLFWCLKCVKVKNLHWHLRVELVVLLVLSMLAVSLIRDGVAKASGSERHSLKGENICVAQQTHTYNLHRIL